MGQGPRVSITTVIVVALGTLTLLVGLALVLSAPRTKTPVRSTPAAPLLRSGIGLRAATASPAEAALEPSPASDSSMTPTPPTDSTSSGKEDPWSTPPPPKPSVPATGPSGSKAEPDVWAEPPENEATRRAASSPPSTPRSAPSSASLASSAPAPRLACTSSGTVVGGIPADARSSIRDETWASASLAWEQCCSHVASSGRLGRATFACDRGRTVVPCAQVNDNFCDCEDGTDEPGTAACPDGRFFCAAGVATQYGPALATSHAGGRLRSGAGQGARPASHRQPAEAQRDALATMGLLHTSKLLDGICDCCDGSDELAPAGSRGPSAPTTTSTSMWERVGRWAVSALASGSNRGSLSHCHANARPVCAA